MHFELMWFLMPNLPFLPGKSPHVKKNLKLNSLFFLSPPSTKENSRSHLFFSLSLSKLKETLRLKLYLHLHFHRLTNSKILGIQKSLTQLIYFVSIRFDHHHHGRLRLDFWIGIQACSKLVLSSPKALHPPFSSQLLT